jgi:hypothetical protein
MAKKTTGPTDESTSGYFRRIFKENPRWLKAKTNQEIEARWIADHPGDREIPQRAKYILSNVKSTLRSKRRRKRAAIQGTESHDKSMLAPVLSQKALKGLAQLEAAIDDCLAVAKNIDREALADVIAQLRTARNAVVWKMG